MEMETEIRTGIEFVSMPISKIEYLRNQIVKNGIAFFDGEFTTEEFVAFSRNFGYVYPHRDSESNGITVVKSVYENEEAKSGYYGMTNAGLFPHTDRSTLGMPPNILVFYCRAQETEGGESLLIDGKKIYSHFIEKYGEESCPLLDGDSVIFADASNIYRGSIFEEVSEGFRQLRFRNDNFSYFNPNTYPYLAELYQEMEKEQISFKLKSNQGYIINNGRFFHGRKNFYGEREMWRLLLNDNFMKYRGFPIN